MLQFQVKVHEITSKQIHMQMQDEQLNILNNLKEVINYKLLNSFKVKVNEHIDFMLLNSRLSQVLILNDLISKIRFFFQLWIQGHLILMVKI